MGLHLQKVADRMGEKRGAGQSLNSYIREWIDPRGQIRDDKRFYQIVG